MEVYHGSLEIVSRPEIRVPNRTLDYGNGFYTTTSYNQAKAWTKRKLIQAKKDVGYINVYEFDKRMMDTLNTITFEKPSEKWVDFVMANRAQKGFRHSYDIVYGPVANDKVYAAFALYEGGLLNKRTLIDELKAYRLADQLLFHTTESLRALRFKTAEEVKI